VSNTYINSPPIAQVLSSQTIFSPIANLRAELDSIIARWNLRDSKKDRTMEEVILKTVAAFLNT
jgi:hypothetical protein